MRLKRGEQITYPYQNGSILKYYRSNKTYCRGKVQLAPDNSSVYPKTVSIVESTPEKCQEAINKYIANAREKQTAKEIKNESQSDPKTNGLIYENKSLIEGIYTEVGTIDARLRGGYVEAGILDDILKEQKKTNEFLERIVSWWDSPATVEHKQD